jgi:hypothetical protein
MLPSNLHCNIPKTICVLFLLVFLAPCVVAVQNLSASEAKQHVGEQAIVCGIVETARFAERTRGQPTFLNFDKPYPDQIFTVVIWGENRSKFGSPEAKYSRKRICVAGTIKEYRNFLGG